MNRLLFEKTGDAIYLSHLDVMRLFQRAFRRADILIWHSQGFSPRAYVSIALPLSVGVESRCEILDFEIEDGSADLARLPELLNRTMPTGIRVLRAYESAIKVKHLTYLQSELALEYDAGIPAGAEQALAALFARPAIPVEKRSKKGGMTDVDIRPLLHSLTVQRTSDQALTLNVVASAQNPGMNPQLLLTAIARHLPELSPDFARIRRLEIYDEQMEVFR